MESCRKLWVVIALLWLSIGQAWADDTLSFNEQLTLNEYLVSSNGSYRMYMQGDGNLVLRDWTTRQSLWSTGTHGQNAIRIKFQSDGNLVMRDKRGRAVWSSKTNRKRAIKAVLQNDGNFVIYTSSGAPVWATDTAQIVPDTQKPVITLNGSATIQINQGQEFDDPGATAEDDRDGAISHLIKTTGTVDSNISGTYELRYDVSDSAGNAAESVSRTIEVLPAVPSNSLGPDQQLLTNQRLTSNNGDYFLYMQGDGNLVLRDEATRAALWSSGTNGSGAIRFRLQGDGNLVMRNAAGASVWSSKTHGSGASRLTLLDDGNLVLLRNDGSLVWQTNTSQVITDNQKPIIRLIGSSTVTLFEGESFIDPGASASDNLDGNISDQIRISGFVDTSSIGLYTLRYDVSDSAGNQAEPIQRSIEVIEERPDTGGGQLEGPGSGKGTAVSRGQFTTPSAALYALNDSRMLAFPQIIDTGFSGNGHSETWDGRIFVRKRSQGWFASAFRPERITQDANGVVNFRNGAFGNSVMLEASNANPDIHQNWLAIVPDFSVAGANPFPSNSAGDYSENGTHETYKAVIYQTSTLNGDNDQMGYRLATIVVRDAQTRDAQVISARFTNGFQRLRSTSGRDVRCIEPSVTMDGRLIICQGHPDNNGRIDNLVYSWNATPNGRTGWSTPKSIANMYWDDRDRDVDGVVFSERFPLAQRPLLDATGNDYNRNELVKGAYPWVSHDGAELFYQASREGVSARRTATTVVGRWTGWTFRHIDGPINPNRHRDTRLFVSSPGAFTTMWTPYKNVDDLKIPYSVRGPAYPIFGSNNHDYSEVGFDDYLDGNFILYYGMNEQIDRGGAFQRTRTNDTSGNFNNGNLVGARFPLEYNNRDELVGRYGQAIYFARGNYIDVQKQQGWESLADSATVDLWVRKLSGSGTIPLFTLGNGIELQIDNSNRIIGRITNDANQQETVTGGSIAANTWTHVALTFHAERSELALYVNSQKVALSNIGTFGDLQTTGSLRIGPQSANALLLIDEVKVSNIAREPYEIAHYANVNSHKPASAALMNTIPDYLESLRFGASGIDRYSRAAAELGEDLFNDVILSKQRSTSCASCHIPGLAFTDGREIARGNEPTDQGVRNTPPLQNRLFSRLQGWSGAASSLDVQALIPIQAEHEMNLPIAEAQARLQADDGYRARFQNVYGELPTAANISAALASFQATQYAPENRVDEYLAGNRGILSDAEKRGLNLFNGKARCSGCHAGVNYTDESFRNNGLTSDADIGRADTTSRDRDVRLFKVPTLRQLNLTAPYMHDGSLPNLRAVVEAYDQGAPSVVDKDTDIRPLELSDQEINDLISFLEALTN